MTVLNTHVLLNEPLSDEINHLAISVPQSWRSKPGQVVVLKRMAGGIEGYFALADTPLEVAERGQVNLYIRAWDTPVDALMRLESGEAVGLLGPYGAGFDIPAARAGRRLVFASVGVAFSALRSGVWSAYGAGHREITVLVGVRNERDLYFQSELDEMRRRGIEVVLTMTQPSGPGLQGRVQEHVGELPGPDVYLFLAGSEAFEDEMRAIFVAGGTPVSQVQRNFRDDSRGLTVSSGG